MNTEPESSTKITYTVRELLAEIRATVANIDSKLDNKADKAVVENLVNRVAIIETERKSEREYGQEIFAEYKNLLKEHVQVKLDINSLQTNKKDKETFNALWIPVIFNALCTIALGLYAFVHIH